MAKKTKSGSGKGPAAKKAAKTSKKTSEKASKKKTSKKKTSKKKTSKKAATKKAATKPSSAKKKDAAKKASKKSGTKKKASKPAAKKTAKKTAKKASKKARPARQARAKAPASHAERALAAPGRRGQVAAEKARFETGSHAPVLQEELGGLPPGYGLSIVRAWIRNPSNVAIVWDINDPEMVALAERVGWDAIGVRVLDEAGAILRDLRVGTRSGIYHLELPGAGLSLRMALGLHREDGFFETLALSGPVRLPPDAPAAEDGPFQTIRLEEDLDRRLLTEREAPPRPGHRAPSALPPGARLSARLELAYRSAIGSSDEPGLAARLERAIESGRAEDGDLSGHAPEHGDAGGGERPHLRAQAEAGAAARRAAARRDAPSSRDLVGGPSSDSRPSSPTRPSSPGAPRR